MALTPGKRLGPYEIVTPLGAGGMGEVYRARDSRLDRDVAIKVLPEHLSKSPQALVRFEREVKAVAALSHPNILAIHDVGDEQGIRFAVTELLEGQTLRSRLEGSGLPLARALEIATAVAEGLTAAHSKSIIHRDLKPENIFVTSDGRVKILDFGLARFQPPPSAQTQSAIPTETDAGTVLGTVGYMSPEQVRGVAADAASDIFSLGCVLYEMLAGQRAFMRQTPTDTLAAILRDDPPPLAESRKKIPMELERVVGRCLEKSPAQRMQSARDLVFALRDVGGPAGAEKRSTQVWTAGAVAAMLLVGAAFYLLAGRGQAIDSLAVLPFVNVGADPNTEYLSDGITENLINSFSQLPKLRVVPRGRVFRYKGRETDTEKIGRELNVRAVLTGRVVQRGDSLNIQTELVDVAADSQLWGRQYNRKFSEIIPVQEEIAKEVSEKLRLRPTGEEQKRLAKRYTEDPEAHQLYLKGRYYWNRRTSGALQRATEYFQQAIEKDPGYALAWAGLADSYAVCGYDTLPPREAIPKAKEAAGKAPTIDETQAEPHAVLGFVKNLYDWDWPGAEREFKRAIELNPKLCDGPLLVRHLLGSDGAAGCGISEGETAQEADPLSLIIGATAGRTLYHARRYDQAIEQLRKTLEMDPNFPLAHWVLGMAYEQVGRHEEALASARKR